MGSLRRLASLDEKRISVEHIELWFAINKRVYSVKAVWLVILFFF